MSNFLERVEAWRKSGALVLPTMFFGFIVFYTYGYDAGKISKDREWRKILIEKGYAEYDKETGKWRWKE